ncbi:MAG: cytochrome c oxidase assembly protein [Actinomycetota bacterium]|nr:cytochrome c oxidase assembly protein [Actinomycetota bacterium]
MLSTLGHVGQQTPALLAHAGQPVAPNEVWGAWNLDPVLVAGLLALAALYVRGGRAGGGGRWRRWRTWAFWAAIGALAVALLSPLEAMSAALASAHMVQHVLLILVAAPLLAFSAPSSTLLGGAPVAVRRVPGRLRRRLRLPTSAIRPSTNPATVWLLHVAVLWIWHSATAYEAALGSELLHGTEHLLFLVTALLFWRVVLGGRRSGRVPEGAAVLLVFGMAMQSVFLSLLLTFASEPWYAAYTTTTAAWGLVPLADQQLAGVLMWVPAGMVYMAIGLALFVSWIHHSERATM